VPNEYFLLSIAPKSFEEYIFLPPIPLEILLEQHQVVFSDMEVFPLGQLLQVDTSLQRDFVAVHKDKSNNM
jgi:hypothetical protein